MDVSCSERATGASEAEGLLKAMAHAQRLSVLCCLSDGETTSTGIARRAGLRLPVVSHHLGILRHAGIIASQRVGRRVIHTIDSARAARVLNALRGA